MGEDLPDAGAARRGSRSSAQKMVHLRQHLGSALFFFFHESYHTGQAELLRQASDKDDKVI
jgi:uncharacterized damage-inducible protein DinB